VFCPPALRSRTAAENVRGSRWAEAGWIDSVALLWLGSIAISAWQPWANWTRGENPKASRYFGEEADGFPPASVRAGKLRRREAVRLADIRYAPERKTRPSCLV
jgi:hypothetical protein